MLFDLNMPQFSWGRRKTPLLILAALLVFLYVTLVARHPQHALFTDHRASGQPKIQYAFKPSVSYAQPERLDAVRREFLHAWDSYLAHGWMADSLGPLTGKSSNQFCGWSATLVDALDTLWLMGLRQEFDQAVDALPQIHFDSPNNTCTVNLFEVTIRHLGGLLAAYDLSQDARILPKMVELGDVLHRAFYTRNGMPCSHCRLMSEVPPFSAPNHIAVAAQGSLYLEFARLSQITGDPTYMRAVQDLTEVFVMTQNDSTIPGLWPETVDASSVTGEARARNFARISSVYSVGALSDSTYEYLVKSHLLLGGKTDRYRQMWELASERIKRLLLFRAQLPGAEKQNLIFAGKATRKNSRLAIYQDDGLVDVQAWVEHLGCFAGGMFALSSKVFGVDEDLYIGEGLTNGCVWSYKNSPLGIMAEAVTLMPCDDEESDASSPPTSLPAELSGVLQKQCKENATIWSPEERIDPLTGENVIIPRTLPAGIIKAQDSRYLLRPEAIESVFIMWRLTGDRTWRDVGWEMFQAIRTWTRSVYGHASLKDVFQKVDQHGFIIQRKPSTEGQEPEEKKKKKKKRPAQTDEMESFWFGETLKYFYLLFADVNVLSLDHYVLNTEAHPLRLTEGWRGL